LGYRKGQRAGRWLVRWYSKADGYTQETIATADDVMDADGAIVLTFTQASSHARKVAALRRARNRTDIPSVGDVVRRYIVHRSRRDEAHGIRKRDASGRLTKHVLSNAELSKTRLRDLKESALIDWMQSLTDLAPATVRRLSNDLR